MESRMPDKVVDTIKGLIARDQVKLPQFVAQRDPSTVAIRAISTSTAECTVAERCVEGESGTCSPERAPPLERSEAGEELNRARWIKIFCIFPVSNPLWLSRATVKETSNKLETARTRVMTDLTHRLPSECLDPASSCFGADILRIGPGAAWRGDRTEGKGLY